MATNSAGTDEEEFPGHLLHQAALWDNRELLLDLLRGDLRTAIESQDSWGRTPLHAAATTQDSSCLVALLEAGANPNAVSGGQDNFKTPLHTSAEHGFLANVKALVAAGADVFRLEGRALTPAELALRGAHGPTHQYLLSVAQQTEEARGKLHQRLREAVTRGDAKMLESLLKPLPSNERKDLLNKTPHGTNSLLFKACESGETAVVKILLENGADGRIHPVTKYSPLYIAAYHGHKDILNLLLEKFPFLVQVPTVEKWLPLHAATINGNVQILETLLNFPYPKELMRVFTLKGQEETEFEMVFDINGTDVSGQTALYIACQMGNTRLVQSLLKFRVPVKELPVASPTEPEPPSPTKPSRRLSEGIQGILSKLSLVTNQNLGAVRPKLNLVCPLDLDLYCENFQTALHLAVRQGNHTIASALLACKADPNLPIHPPPSQHLLTPISSHAQAEQNIHRLRDESSTALVEACRRRDLGMIDLLLKHGARDEDSKALHVAAKDDLILGKILALKVHQDAENRINVNQLKETVGVRGGGKTLLSTSILPTTPVTVNWHGQRMEKVSEQWLISGAMKLNPRLRLCPKSQDLALHAITRLDLSTNSLETVPPSLFTLASLTYLNLSQNKIQTLSFPNQISAPLLQELLLHENRFEACPAQLFTNFPALVTLNLSNNKLMSLPPALWQAPNLQELNVSLNLLSDLPPLSGADTEILDLMPVSRPEPVTEPTPPSPSKSPSRLRLKSNSSKKSAKSPPDFPSARTEEPLLVHHGVWRESLKVISTEEAAPGSTEAKCPLLVLNLSHNSFVALPRTLPCLVPMLQRLNLAFNSLESLGAVQAYPPGLRQLDVSHNQLTSWFTPSLSNVRCSAKGKVPSITSPDAADTVACPHRGHRRLDHLKTLLLAGNGFKYLQISPDADGQDDKKEGLWFPNVTMLDLSENRILELSPTVSQLSSLSVLNLSGNKELSDLPPQLGLLSRVWNLSLLGCSLQEPLKTLIERKRCKTMDILGYLKSVLEDAKAYSRMKLMLVGVQGIGKTTLLSMMRAEGGSQKQGPTDHWAKRMGATTGSNKGGKSGKPLSTVGVDIGSLVLEGRGGRSAVTFRTWDFGGQREYYATHLYFLSKRSLYLVLWNVCDGEKGLNEILQWLVNIQARAPNSPVIIIGTHLDLVSEKFPPGYLDYLQQRIRDKFICVADPEKRGLPRVMYSIEISCRARTNIRQLVNLVFETVWSLKTSNGKTLLEQKIPSKYIHLEEIIAYLATERKAQGLDPVLTESEFKIEASKWLEKGFNLSFRDDAEINQACSFLHENGILLHYEDSTLRELYFLDPQWLCDMLAHVVTIREINPFVKSGVMKLDDLARAFKGHSAATREYITSLLSKFELAIPWDNLHLLIPSLLPTLEQLRIGDVETKVRVPVRSRGWTLQSPKRERMTGSAGSGDTTTTVQKLEKSTTPSLSRFILLSYFPSGFWPRLMSRILSDDRVVEIVRNYFQTPSSSNLTPEVMRVLDERAEWSCWQTGLELSYGQVLLVRVKEVTGEKPFTFMLRRDEAASMSTSEIQIEEQVWDVVDLTETGLLEIYLPGASIGVESAREAGQTQEKVILGPSIETLAKLLALVVDHVDTLLEDWYPSLGTRFVHTSEGKYLVTRLIPCPRCFPNNNAPVPDTEDTDTRGQSGSPGVRTSSDSGVGTSPRHSSDMPAPAAGVDEDALVRTRAGFLFETPKFGQTTSYSSGLNFFLRTETKLRSLTRNMYSWSVEHCILNAQEESGQKVRCPKHGDTALKDIAPDLLFLDLQSRFILPKTQITRNQLLGRGAFGFVFGGQLVDRGGLDVAIKMFQPIDPGEENTEAQTAFQVARSKWTRSPAQSACRAYLAARGEVRVLYWVAHSHVVPFLGLSQSPLAIVMPRAPRGALDSVLADLRRSGAKVERETAQLVILQIAKALEYLHSHRIIVRDLKSENVLVWNFPQAFAPLDERMNVDLKLADYGISRCSFPTGSKGFGGTEGFMAPEIIRYNGEEEYTDKVDIFSFGMVLYEVLSLNQPFTGAENVKESILEGERPALTPRDLDLYSVYILDLMVLCWAHSPNERPSATDIVTFVSSPQFLLLRDVVSIGALTTVVAAIGIQKGDTCEMWASCSTGGLYSLKLGRKAGFDTCQAFDFIPGVVTAMSLVSPTILWMGDTLAKIHIYQPFSDTPEAKVGELEVEAQVGEAVGACVSIQGMGSVVAVAYSSGRLFLLNIMAGTVLTELGNSTLVHALACRSLSNGVKELWSGERGGEMRIFSIRDSTVIGQESVNHYEKDRGRSLEVLQVLLIHAHSGNQLMFSYVFPGSVVYGWEGEAREMGARLDVGKLLPSPRETMGEELLAKPLQVTVLYSTDSDVFIGTNWGLVFRCESTGLAPLASYQLFTQDVRAIWFFPPPVIEEGSEATENAADAEGALVLFGKGFSHLMTPNMAGRRKRAFALLATVYSPNPII